ncbi:TcpQ domain-containing protein [Lelliottia wanjuensis]|uniref:TcpQ domain-containing protein n=1 Tax=Lelliottia wanjuensis TaxID=3050585 RepID=UPI00254E29E0|nr:TcpQ domain-containing protein [Lelliottia sp. V104_15]MDK9605854.1 TcpQ domain-containing protein [Lelliottia sp. V104_15]
MSFTERAGVFPLLLLTGCAQQAVVTGPPSGGVVDSMLSRSAADISAMQYRLHQSGPSAQRPVSPSAKPVAAPLMLKTPVPLSTPASKFLPVAPATAAGNGPASGFVKTGGAEPTLRAALRKIIPAGQTVVFDKAVSPDSPELWRWAGNDRWPFVVEKMLTPHGLKATVNAKTNTVTVEPLQASKPQPASPKSASSPLPANRPDKPVAAKPTTAPAPGRNPFRGDAVNQTPTAAASSAHMPVKPVIAPVVVPVRHWRIETGNTVKDWLYSQAAAETCTVPGIKNWTVAWMTPVNYRVDAPLVFEGDFRTMLNRLFTLYGGAKVPLYAGVRAAQCVVSVDDKEVQ